MLFLAVLASLFALAQAANHQVVVGGAAGLVFTPENITAVVGDTVTFIFQTKNHTVTQSAFANPCALLQNATTNAVGFDSGFVPVAENATSLPAWTLEVTSAAPIWYFCAQGAHCKAGMVGSINAATTGNRTFADFKALAMSGSTATTPTGSASISDASTGVGAEATGGLSSIDTSDVAEPAASSTPSNTGSASTLGSSAVAIVLATLALLVV